MNFFERNRNLVFWATNFLSWFVLNLFSVFVLRGFSTQFVLFSVIAGTLIGLISTGLLRTYLKRVVDYDSFSTNTLIKVGISFIIASGIFGLLNFGFGWSYAHMFPPNEKELQLLEKFSGVGILIFSSLFNIFIWLCGYVMVKLGIRYSKNKIERLTLNDNLKQAQLNTLKGQINPHFMFNSLNNIRGLMLEDVEKSREMLTKLSEMLRYSLTKNNIDAIALSEELEMVDNFIELSRIQFENRLQFRKSIQPGVEGLLIPPMIIQLLVENATKHGISQLPLGGYIQLNITTTIDRLHIEVRNTGELNTSRSSTKLGLENIKQRLELLYGKKGNFKLYQENKEVIAIIEIPRS